MSKSKWVGHVIESLEIVRAGAEGKSIGKFNDRVVFVQGAVPGDIADVQITRQKSSFYEARVIVLHKTGPSRVKPACAHFGICGGCKWQHMNYTEQLKWKEQQVRDNFTRLGKLEWKEFIPILGARETFYYRNKLEFTFSDQQWLTADELKDPAKNMHVPSLGFHIPGRFDKVQHITECQLQPPLHNEIRNFIYAAALECGLVFQNLYERKGDMRNLILRNNLEGDWMAVVVFGTALSDAHTHLLERIKNKFPQITSLLYTINTKPNDTIHDLEIHVYAGQETLTETLDGIRYRISAKSFFQTNPEQTLNLYKTAVEMAAFSGNETAFDLYTGTGSIALFVSRYVSKITGIESVQQAVEDARQNARENGITNADFMAGDMKDVLTKTFLGHTHKPDIIITDPPRAGMHPSVLEMLKQSGAKTIIYISCNPATQARDLDGLREFYNVETVKPVDMFPHTHHVECVVKLSKRLN